MIAAAKTGLKASVMGRAADQYNTHLVAWRHHSDQVRNWFRHNTKKLLASFCQMALPRALFAPKGRRRRNFQ
ncbi:hypothetical protein ATY78_03185 [Rhizobium sp. R635]|nr:hypothetical protein ATY78_03185 [Rhizobium sp. R635]